MSNETKYLLAAHIGGTKARLGLVKLINPNDNLKQNEPKFIFKNRYSIEEFPDPFPLFDKFIEECEKELTLPIKLKKACIAVAGPVEDNRCKMTNWSLGIDGNSLADQLSLSSRDVQLINDFEAVAYGIKDLQTKDILILQEGEFQENKPIAVIGAATGMGKSFLVQCPEKEGKITYTAYPTEGGHTNFAPRSPLEFALLQYILYNVKDENNRPLTRVSVERVVSGRGIVAIYRFLKDCQNDPNKSPWLQGLPDRVKYEIEEVKVKLQSLKKEVGQKNLKDYPLSQQHKEEILQIYQDNPLDIFLEELERKLAEVLNNQSNTGGKQEIKKPEIIDKFSEPKQIEKLITIWWREDERCRENLDPAAVIASAALKKSDPLCIYAMQIFLQIYGAELGNAALQFLPYGGLYMAGGITPQILPLIEEEKQKILDAFTEKGRLSKELKKIPLYVLKNLEAGLIGAAYYAEHKINVNVAEG